MLRTIGLMSGTSLDGVDAAWVETDGERIGRLGPSLTLPYDPKLKADLRRLLDIAPVTNPYDPFLLDCVWRLTERHVEAVERLREQVRRTLGEEVDLLGFHGQTILHRPRPRSAEGRMAQSGESAPPDFGPRSAEGRMARSGESAPPDFGPRSAEGRMARSGESAAEAGWTWQVGDSGMLAKRTGLSVAYDFRSADVAAGGQGAPLVPVVHAALAAGLPKPLAVLNLGGVANVTWIGADGALLAFDTGPANGPLDDWVRQAAGKEFDKDGRLALAGQPDGAVLSRLMHHPYLTAPPPKSLDRLDFDRTLKEAGVATLSPEDGAATLVAFCAICVAAGARHFPEPAGLWLVGGGGRRNPALMKALSGALETVVRPVEVVGWHGDALEAQAFGVLAARVARGLPLTFPGTTGVAAPLTGGKIIGGLL